MLNMGKLWLVLFSLLFVGGCVNPAWTTTGRIVPPVYNVCPLEGKWTVIQALGSEGYSGKTILETEGSYAQFSREFAILGSNVWKKTSYKIKKVNSTDYLMTRYTALDSYLASINKEVEVVTIFADSNYLGEFMIIDDSTIISFVQNKMLLLKKVADHADDPRSVANANIMDTNQYSNSGTSGIFIGLKIPDKNDYSYKTIWVAADDKKLRPVLSRNNIVFPRKSGFWELQVRRVQNKKEITDELSARNVAAKDSAIVKGKVLLKQAQPTTNSKIIDYIGNDYVAIENSMAGNNKLQILPVDNLSSPIGIKVADLLGDKGLTAYRSARELALRTLHDEGIAAVDEDMSEDNLGLTRKNGHWHLQGRINYPSNGRPGTRDFNINFTPPASLIVYDTVYLSWQNIKDRVPNALDAFTSPNQDIAIIETKNKLYIFGISGEQLDSVPLGEIELQEGAAVVMAEWATGFYVDNWERTFLTIGAQTVKNSAL